MKANFLLVILIFVCFTANAFAQTTSERAKLARQIKADFSNTELNVKGFASRMTVEKVDLNFDGKPEYIVTGTSDDFCGAMNCTYLIYRKVGAKFVNMSGGGLFGRGYTVGKTKTKGYSNLLVRRNNFSGGGTTIYKFNGNSYQ